MNIKRMGNPGALKTSMYVPGKLKREVERELGLSNIINMSLNESASGASDLAKDAYLKIADQLHVYSDSISRDLRQKLARKLGCKADQTVYSPHLLQDLWPGRNTRGLRDMPQRPDFFDTPNKIPFRCIHRWGEYCVGCSCGQKIR